MHLITALAAVHRHPRHVVLFSLTTGLLLGPLSQAATLIASAAAAGLTIAAATSVPRRGATHRVEAAATVHGRTPTRTDATTASATRWGLDAAPTEGLPTRTDAATGRASEAREDGAMPSSGGGVAPAVGAAASGAASIVAIVAAGAVLAGAVIADLRLAAIEGGRLAGLEGRAIAGRAVLLEPVRERSWGPAVARARLLSGAATGEMAVLRVQPAVHAGAWPGVGETVDVTGKVARLGPYDAYQGRRGAAAALDVSRLRATGERRGGISGIVDAARRRAEDGLTRGLDPPRAALLRGMVLGQDEQLADATRDDFERSGLAHILAVSGQNVMLLATLVLAVGAVTGIGLRARLMLALLLVALYVPLTGAGPSIQRAGVMGAAGLVAALAGRPAHRWYALGLAAAVTLALNPRAAGEPGWQLSFAAVVALLGIAPGLRGVLARALPGPVADVAAMTVAATVGTAPLMALHFEQVSLAALPANLLAAAAIAPVMWLGMLAAAAAQIAPALAAPLNAANGPLLGFIEWVARTMAAAPVSVLPVRITSPASLALAYAAIAATTLVLRAAWLALAAKLNPSSGLGGASFGAPRGPPASPRRAAVRGLALATAGGAALLLAVAPATGGGVLPARGELVVSFLDVGQGDATLLQLRGVAVLVDTGPSDGPIVQRLREAGVRRLDALVLTHAQTDHEGAALPVMRAYPPRLVVNGGAGWPTAVQRALPEAIRAAGARRLDAHAGQTLRTGGIRMRMLWPPPPGPGFLPDGDPNHRALVAHVEFGDFDLLLPADAESDVTAALDLPEVEALKVAHHGSADEGLPALLERTDPEVAAIEVGRDNSYGHPAPSTLAALRSVPHVFRTDRDGTIRLRVRDGRIRLEPR